MKNGFVFVLLSLSALLFSVTIDGHAYLEGETDHSGIEVFFQRVVPDTLYSNTVYTDSTGYYSSIIESGYYDVKYSKTGFRTALVEDALLYSDQTLAEQNLTVIGLEGSIKGVLTAGEYNVTGTLTVLEGDSLIIEPGVVMNFKTDTFLQINGYLQAEGTETDSIIFRSLNSNGTGLYIGNGLPDCNARMYLDYCSLRDFEYSINIAGNYNSTLFKISNSYINAENECITYFGEEGNELEINNVLMEGSYIGIAQGGAGLVSLYKCYITNCGYACYTHNGDGLTWKIDNSIISSSNHGLYSALAYCNIYIYNTSIVAGENGLDLTYQSNNIEISNSIIYAEVYGISFMNGFTHGSGSKYVSYSNVIGKVDNFYNCGSYLGIIVTTNSNGDPSDGYFNIALDPKFSDADNGDFSLQSDSPCIDAGTNTIDGYTFPIADLAGNYRIWDGDGNGSEIVDMGAYEYGAPVGIEEQSVEVSDYKLHQNYPNPFNPVTSISYALPQASDVELNVYNLNGQLVQSLVNGRLDKGMYKAEFNGADLTSGMYIYNLKVDNRVVSSKKMMLLK